MESDSNSEIMISKWLYENLAIDKIAKDGKITYKLLPNVGWPEFILKPLNNKTNGLTWKEVKEAFPFHK